MGSAIRKGCVFLLCFFSLAMLSAQQADVVRGSVPHYTKGIAAAWFARVTLDRVDDTTTTSFLLPSTDGSAYLHLACINKAEIGNRQRAVGRDLYISTGEFLDQDASVEIRIDNAEPMFKQGIRSNDYKAVFLEDAGNMKAWYEQIGQEFPADQVDYVDFLPAVLGANRLLFKLARFESTHRVWEFHPNGVNLKEIERACKLSELGRPDQPPQPPVGCSDRSGGETLEECDARTHSTMKFPECANRDSSVSVAECEARIAPEAPVIADCLNMSRNSHAYRECAALFVRK